MRLFLATFAVFALTGCAALQNQVCNSDKASEAGKNDAAAWSTDRKGLQTASFCDGAAYSTALYQRDYDSAFRATMAAQCSEASVNAMASDDARQGKMDRVAAGQFKACDGAGLNSEKVASTYSLQFQKDYCTSDRISGFAAQAASRFSPPDQSWKATCSRHSKALASVYKKAYKTALAERCTGVNIAQMAYNDAESGQPIQAGLKKVALCPSQLQSSALTQYEHSFNEGLKTAESQRSQAAANGPASPFANLNALAGNNGHLSPQDIQKLKDSRTDFNFAGQPLYSTCRVLPGNLKTEISVSNAGNGAVSQTATWSVDLYDSVGRIIRRNTTAGQVNVGALQTATFQVPTMALGAASCKAVASN